MTGGSEQMKDSDRSAQDPQTPFLVVEDLVGCYGERKVLDRVSLSARRGEITTILGTSGCGKSTLLRHIVGLKHPVSGRVLIGGRDLYQASEDEQEEILTNVGMAFQSGALFNSMSLQENVALPIREHTDADEATADTLALMKLSLVGLSASARLLPAEISGGMKKRAALARALALDPTLLLFDEPSAGLDPVTARELDDLILRLRDQLGVAIVIVTHELGSIEAIADQAVMLHKGRVLAKGPLAEVRALPHPQVRAFFDRRAQKDVSHKGLLDRLTAPAPAPRGAHEGG
jgi:phospholipid/cholesterol/gamma-HCH transport system ATP-binding protein